MGHLKINLVRIQYFLKSKIEKYSGIKLIIYNGFDLIYLNYKTYIA